MQRVDQRLPLRTGSLIDWTVERSRLTAVYEHAAIAISVLDGTLVRIRLAPDGRFAPRRSWAVAPPDEAFPSVALEVEHEPTLLRLRAADLTITLGARDGRLAIVDRHDRPFWEDGTTGGPSWSDEGRARWTRGMPMDERYFGFGERTGILDKRGRRYTCWTTDEWQHQGPSTDALYVAIPFFFSLDPQGRSTGIFLNNTFKTSFDLTGLHREELHIDVEGGELDYYALLGDDPAAVVKGFTSLTGRMPLPPRWALGYHQARWTYTPDAEVLRIAQGFRERRIPCDAIHLDIDHMDECRVFTWDPVAFADPARLCRALADRGFNTVVIVDAGIKQQPDGYPVYADGHERGMFVRRSREPDAEEFTGHVWPGLCVFPDHTRDEVRKWWGQWYGPHLQTGVAGFLNDMNEPAMHDRPYVDETGQNAEPPNDLPFGTPDEPTTHAEVRNVYALLENRGTYDALRALRPDRRPFLITRAGYAGIQRYAGVWSGDLASVWEHLEMTLPELMNLGLSGVAFAGADVGGFFGNCDGELLARWTQLGAFYPLFRNNSAKRTAPQEPWAWGRDTEDTCRRAIELRYRLLPYLYTVFEEARRTGAPILRPLFYHYASDARTHALDDQAMLGSELLLAPVLRPGRAARHVYLPHGLWYDWRTGERIEGPRDIVARASLDMDLPLYARGGAVIPVARVAQSTSELTADPLILDICPDDEGRASGSLYEDDGLSFDYERGISCVTTFRCELKGRRGVVSAEATGQLPWQARDVVIRLASMPGVDQVVARESGASWAVEFEVTDA